ncbi:MAG: serine hydrolase [Candidatus Kryptoniota bacterium]
MRTFTVLTLAAILTFITVVNAQSLQDSVNSFGQKFNGDIGVYAINLANGDSVSFNADKLFPTASVIKIYVLGKLYHDVKEEKLSLNDKVILRDSDKVPGSSILLFMHNGMELTLNDLAWLMINMSDNVAANLLVEKVGGVEKVTGFIRSLGLSNTKMLAKIFDKKVYSDSVERDIYGIGVTTPRETAIYLSKLYKGQVVDSQSSKAMVDLMKYQFYNTSIPRFLPTYRDTIEIAHKTGALDETRNDCAIICTPRTNYILCVFTNHNADQRWITDNSGELFIAKISKLVYENFVR